MTATVVPSSWAPLDGAALVAFRLIGAVVGLVEGLWAALLTTVPELKVALKAEPETQVVASEDAVAEPSPAPVESSPDAAEAPKPKPAGKKKRRNGH
ncbi:hypothetical protein QBZ16_002075 [Prototheca wickerhamii]|uniref:Uncharacterized protein n=1 Tax=Prototheca wickerhamii TaxID=3111 RepID=A0AAD9MLG3_PROWI|nr:hypothetical protein QBZ16_002075 [Prototheca wickerhamii]